MLIQHDGCENDCNWHVWLLKIGGSSCKSVVIAAARVVRAAALVVDKILMVVRFARSMCYLIF